MARAFQDAIAGRSTGTAMGVTWTSTRGTIDRLQIAAEHGIHAAHVGHPLYMEMTNDELLGFWDDVSASVPDDFGLIHYNQPRLPNLMNGKSYRPLVERFGKLIGTKFAVDDASLFVESAHLNPSLPHLCGETDMTPMMMLGAKGVCSWFTNVNPRYMVDWYDDCVAGRWEVANGRQMRMLEFSRFKKSVFGVGARAAVVNKALLAAVGFLEGTQTVRAPVSDRCQTRALEEFRRRARDEFADLLLPATPPPERSAIPTGRGRGLVNTHVGLCRAGGSTVFSRAGAGSGRTVDIAGAAGLRPIVRVVHLEPRGSHAPPPTGCSLHHQRAPARHRGSDTSASRASPSPCISRRISSICLPCRCIS